MSVNVTFTLEFKRNLRILSKKYRYIKKDIEPLITALQNGEPLGKQVAGTGFAIFKVRVPNRDIHRGKRGGYRVIYYLQAQTDIILVTIYSKSEQADISAAQVRRIINELKTEK